MKLQLLAPSIGTAEVDREDLRDSFTPCVTPQGLNPVHPTVLLQDQLITHYNTVPLTLCHLLAFIFSLQAKPSKTRGDAKESPEKSMKMFGDGNASYFVVSVEAVELTVHSM